MITTAMDILLSIKSPNHCLFYDPVELCITRESVNQTELKKLLAVKTEEEILITELVSNIMLPDFQTINHEEIMRFFVRECIEDKEIRKTLFNILRRDDYVTPFIDKLKELGLYDDFDDCCWSIYNQIMEEWAARHGIDLTKRK